MITGKRVIVAAARLRGARNEIEDMLPLPDAGEGLWDVKLAEADRVVNRNIKLQVVTRGECNSFVGIHGFENELFDEGRYTAIADHAEAKGLLFSGASATCADDVEAESTVPLLDRIGGQAAANRRARGRTVHQIKAPVVLGTLNNLSLDQAIRKVGVAVGADSICGVELAFVVTLEGVCFLSLVKTDHV